MTALRAVRVILAVGVGFFLAAEARASWSGRYGSGVAGQGESASVVIATSDGGYLIGSVSYGFANSGNGAYWLVKLDANGDISWQKVYSWANGFFVLGGIIEVADGYIVAGQVGSGCYVAWIFKIDLDGVVQWSKTYATNDPDPGHSGCGTSAAGLANANRFVVVGTVAGYFGVMHVDPTNGALLSARAYLGGATQGNAGAFATSVVPTPDIGFVVAGTWVNPDNTKTGYRVLKLDSLLDPVWEETFGGALQDIPLGVTASWAGPGTPIITVVTGNGGTVGGGIWTIAIDDSGVVVWQKTYTVSAGEYGKAIVTTPDGGYAIAGLEGGPNSVLMKLGADGTIQWTKQFAQGTISQFNSLVATTDGGLLAAGFDNAATLTSSLAVKADAGGAFVGCLNEEVSRSFTETTTSVTPVALADSHFQELGNTVVADQAVTVSDTTAAENVVCSSALPPILLPGLVGADLHVNGGSSDGNGVADPGELFIAQPSWTNVGGGGIPLSGVVSAIEDSNGLDTINADRSADYGTIAPAATANCYDATGDCYVFGLLPIIRPSQHWDVTFDETITASDPHHAWGYRWTLHAGHSFGDASATDQFYKYIETLFHNGVTGGCGGGNYCPGSPVTRGQMAVFLLKGEHGGTYTPPVCSATVFADVPCPGGPFVDWVNQLASENITGGCGGGNYCPGGSVTRGQMAVFLLKGEHGGAYAPPACVATVFGDVACPGAQFVDWINQLAAELITGGCGGGNYCPGNSVTRGQMAVFLTKAFGLALN
jgi:hypothetical protein